MAKRDFLQAKGFYLVTFLLILFSMQPLNLFGQEEKPEKASNIIEIKDNLISLDVKDTDLSEVLKEIEKRTGIKITIGKELIGKKITKSFKNLDVERALRIILGEDYVFVFLKDPTTKDKFVLKEVKAGAAIGSELSKGKMITIEIAYGKGKEEVGAFNAGEGAMGGPSAFAFDDKGNIYIADALNNRIQIFSRHGEYISSIPLKKDTGICDMYVDKHGFVYIYDCGGGVVKKIYQYKKDGSISASIDFDSSGWNVYIAPMDIINNNIYIDTCDHSNGCGYFLVGKIINGQLIAATDEELKKPVEKGYGLISGQKYKFTKFIKGEMAEFEIIGGDGTSRIVSFPLKDVFSLEFFGEDEKGNFYLKTNREKDDKLIVEIHKFTASGDYLSTIQMPESKIYFWSVKNYDLSENGTIYRFLPEEDKLRLQIFPTE
jgi:hypothetical protein